MKISVVVPSYNQAAFIEATIQSILSQKGDFDLELIVVDGGSTDGTIDILKRYSDDINWISEKDDGQADAVNKGVAMSKGVSGNCTFYSYGIPVTLLLCYNQEYHHKELEKGSHILLCDNFAILYSSLNCFL